MWITLLLFSIGSLVGAMVKGDWAGVWAWVSIFYSCLIAFIVLIATGANKSLWVPFLVCWLLLVSVMICGFVIGKFFAFPEDARAGEGDEGGIVAAIAASSNPADPRSTGAKVRTDDSEIVYSYKNQLAVRRRAQDFKTSESRGKFLEGLEGFRH